jgi:hypothetical protein
MPRKIKGINFPSIGEVSTKLTQGEFDRICSYVGIESSKEFYNASIAAINVAREDYKKENSQIVLRRKQKRKDDYRKDKGLGKIFVEDRPSEKLQGRPLQGWQTTLISLLAFASSKYAGLPKNGQKYNNYIDKYDDKFIMFIEAIFLIFPKWYTKGNRAIKTQKHKNHSVGC